MLSDKEVIVKLKEMGLGDVMAERVAEHFTPSAVIEQITLDPYSIMKVDGISFIRADKIARNYFSIPENDPRRQKALIYKLLDDQRNLGHTYLPELVLQKEMKKQGITSTDALEASIKAGDIVFEENRIYTAKLYGAELGCARFIKARTQHDFSHVDEVLEYPLSSELDHEQQQAVMLAPQRKILVVTGGPGTGKTFVVNQICNAFAADRLKVGLCAPTGKAAKRLQELTGRPAQTIHRMLGATFGSWRYNQYNPLTTYQAIICDESSMLDIDLCHRLLQAIPFSTKVVFVGDVDQLPPVGPGSPFKDLIQSKQATVVRLKTNHRQGKGSSIAVNALTINNGGQSLILGDDFQFEDCASHIHLREQLPKVLKQLKEEGYDLITEVQVLAPQKTTAVGVEALNDFMRFHLNDKAKRWDKFSVGDKVMQNTNDYQLKIFNGYCGQIVAESQKAFTIQFFDEDYPIIYPKEKIDSLIPAYCCTVHKYQGSEIKAGICIISSSHTYMLTRNLLYTAITRAKEKCVILGDQIALARAIRNTREQERYSKLLERLWD